LIVTVLSTDSDRPAWAGYRSEDIGKRVRCKNQVRHFISLSLLRFNRDRYARGVDRTGKLDSYLNRHRDTRGTLRLWLRINGSGIDVVPLVQCLTDRQGSEGDRTVPLAWGNPSGILELEADVLDRMGQQSHTGIRLCDLRTGRLERCKDSLLHCNAESISTDHDVDEAGIIPMPTVKTVYEVPLMLQRERVDDIVCRLLRLDNPPANMSHWQEIIRKLIAPQHRVRIAVVGKYIELQDAYKSVYEAIIHGGVANDCGIEIQKVDAEDIEREGAEKHLKGLGGILVPGGFGERGIEGKIQAACYARENDIPYLGLCLGMQIATIEFARNVLKLPKAHSTEFDSNTPHPVIAMLDEQTRVTKKGGTMRLGAQPCQLVVGTKTARLYGAFVVNERHRHRYEFNNAYREQFEKAGFGFSGHTFDGKLVEIIELPKHPFFIASQFHPEFHSKPHQPHPFFKGFIAAAHQRIHQKPL